MVYGLSRFLSVVAEVKSEFMLEGFEDSPEDYDFTVAATVSPRRKAIPYICGLGARFGYECVERVFKPPRLKSQI